MNGDTAGWVNITDPWEERSALNDRLSAVTAERDQARAVLATVQADIIQLAADCHVRLDDAEMGTPPLGIIHNEIMRLRSEWREMRKERDQARAEVAAGQERER